MSTTYYLGNTNADIALGTTNKYLETASGVTASLSSGTVAKSSVNLAYFITRAGVPNLSGAGAADGAYSFSVNVTVADANLSLNAVTLRHFNAAGAQIESASGGFSSFSATTTGVKTISTVVDIAFATAWATSDRLALVIAYQNQSSMSTATCTIEVLGTNDWLLAPFGGAVAADQVPYTNIYPPLIAQ